MIKYTYKHVPLNSRAIKISKKLKQSYPTVILFSYNLYFLELDIWMILCKNPYIKKKVVYIFNSIIVEF